MMNKTAWDLNLASQPFGRERAENALLAGICAVLACSLLVLISLFLQTRSRAADLRRQIDAENRTFHRLEAQQQKYSTILRRPENADVFSQSVFLNELIARRGVSWTRVFEDLGTVLPEDMRLLAIRLPQVPQEDASGTNRVQLDMIVESEKPQVVIALLKKLQESSLFGAAAVMTQTPPTQNDPFYKYRVTVPYAQKL